MGHPLAGDGVYGASDIGLGRHFLHAGVLGFRLPGDGRYVECMVPLPPELSAALAGLQSEAALSLAAAGGSQRQSQERS